MRRPSGGGGGRQRHITADHVTVGHQGRRVGRERVSDGHPAGPEIAGRVG
ncbi:MULTISPECIES: hypothetical protein [Micromonospora]|uniref:Uncharacterized protein n=1 Tax=Micromonospora sicca TaxID=2202420 RepID=A0ABU5J9Q2_9ACTN|nr:MULTISPECIES: hypothetical protein [unclassified Micromonospora]MDZ5489317.1 hypothetical protein [Micromonospora sp. 4G53]